MASYGVGAPDMRLIQGWTKGNGVIFLVKWASFKGYPPDNYHLEVSLINLGLFGI